jgi:hypothetical protein
MGWWLMAGPDEEKLADANAEASATVTGADVNLRVNVQDDGTVRCVLTCNNQEAIVTFNGMDVDIDVPS